MLDKLLNTTTGQHGYWLVNHKEIVAEELEKAVKEFGVESVQKTLHDLNSPLVRKVYRLIRKHTK